MEVIETKVLYSRQKNKDGDKMDVPIGKNIIYLRPNGRKGVKFVCLDESLTQQHQAFDQDVHNIVKKHSAKEIFGRFVHDIDADGVIDMPTIDFHEANNQISNMKSQFNSLPSHLRKRFNHRPGEMVDFCTNPDNLPEMIKLGLAIELPQPEVPEVPEVPEGTPEQ